jgi:hypothetical protein
MPQAYHVHGPLYLQTKTNAGSYETLGMSEDGADVADQLLYQDVKTDLAGEAPADVQFRGQTAEISVNLSAWDSAVLAKCLNLSRGIAAASAEGALGAPGTLLGTGSFAFSLALLSASDTPYWWVSTYIMDPTRRLSTKYGTCRLRFRAFLFISGADVSWGTRTLTQRTTPA